MHIEYFRESELLGTSGALHQAKSVFEGGGISRYLCGQSEHVRLERHHSILFGAPQCGYHVRLLGRRSTVVGFDDQCRIQRFLKKPTAEQVFSHYINAGIYVFEPEVFDCIPAKGVSDFSRDVFPRMLAAGALLYAFLFDCYALKFDTFEDWRKSEALIAEKRKLGSVRFLPRHGTHEKRHGVNKCGSSDRRIVATNSA